MRPLILLIVLCMIPMTALAEWQLVAQDGFDAGPSLPWSTEVRGSGSVSFAGGVMAMNHSTGWTLDPTQYGTLATLDLALPAEYRITYRVRNTATCGWIYARVLQGPFFDFSSSAGYSYTTEYCGPNMFISQMPDPSGWHGTRLSDWMDSHLGLNPGLWRSAEITRRSGQLSFYMEGETTLVTAEPVSYPGGTLNFYAHDGYMTAEIDDVKIYAWSEPEPPVAITLGTSWDNISLQEVLDAEYGPGAINVVTDYEGYLPGDGDPAWWQDRGLTSLLVREIAGFASANRLGWYVEDLVGAPVIDGIGDGVIFDGPVVAGSEVLLEFPQDTRFGLYLNPNGSSSSYNAPEPEHFFTNRFYNDIGPDGSGALHAPLDGDVQALIFNISHLRGGVPTYVVAWEDVDSGATVTESWSTTGTDNDYNDLVVEISAFSPVKAESSTWGELKSRFEE